ncbi:zinc finger protein 665-like [Uranotaenia lowii]|uniref:zinc finger protein 665-like n=1 Tax=Uranotaenia lowii TaxID=190385 RepID=UPI00247887C9|nr:zinc finger protein 665-like [Uranotaenia lowii]
MTTTDPNPTRGRPGRPRHPRPKVYTEDAKKATEEDTNQQSNDVGDSKNECKKKTSLSCEICGKTFKHRTSLTLHEATHYGIKNFQCEICSKRFTQKGALKAHIRLHTGELPFKCPHCPKRFRGQTTLDGHIFQHTKQGTSCPQCAAVFATPSIVKRHIREVHTTERAHICQICGTSYKHLKSLRTHLKNHQKRNCPVCGRVFHSIFAMMTHRRVHAEDNYQYKCGFCERKFEKAEEYESHQKLRGRTFQCDACCHSFNKADYLNNHNRRFHWKEMGLEQLKWAFPKGSDNRKRAKGSRKKSDHEEVPPITPDEKYSCEISKASEGKETEVPVLMDNLDQIVQTIATEMDSCSKENVETEVNNMEHSPEHVYENDNYQYDCDDSGFDLEKNETSSISLNFDKILQPEIKQDSTEPSRIENIQDTCEDNPEPSGKIESQSDSDDEIPLAKFVNHTKIPTEEVKVEELSSSNSDGNAIVAYQDHDTKSDIDVFETGKDNKAIKSTAYSSKRRKRKRGSSELDPTQDEWCPKEEDCLPLGRSETKSEKSPYICEICGRSYATSSSLKTHRLYHESKKRFQCSKCPKSFPFRCHLENHDRVEHLRDRFVCSECGKQYKYIRDLQIHIKQHEEDKPFKCDLCPSAFRFPSNLRDHKACHKEKVFPCELCKKEFKYANSLRVHKLLHTGVKRFRCEVCDREFSTKAPLLRHMGTHSKARELKCIACDRIFYIKSELTVHQAKEHPNHPLIGKTVTIHTCDKCGQEFPKKSMLTSHYLVHGNVYSFKCELCEDKTFKQKAGLRQHMMLFHDQEVQKRKLKDVPSSPNDSTQHSNQTELQSTDFSM